MTVDELKGILESKKFESYFKFRDNKEYSKEHYVFQFYENAIYRGREKICDYEIKEGTKKAVDNFIIEIYNTTIPYKYFHNIILIFKDDKRIFLNVDKYGSTEFVEFREIENNL